MTMVVLAFQLMVVFLFLPVIFSSKSSYEKLSGKSAYANEYTFTKKGRYGQIRHEQSLVLKLYSFQQVFTIGPDYIEYWPGIRAAAGQHKNFDVYVRSQGDFTNPMQIESSGKVLLPLSFHKKWSWIILFVLEGFSLIFFSIIRHEFKKYKKHLLKKDKEKWKSGLKGKFKVIWLWLTD